MEVKEAARRAKQYIAELFKEEDAQSIGLEEIELDGATGTWRVTVGFSRPWNSLNEPPFASVTEILGPRKRVRDMKVVTLDDTAGQILSVKNRE
jgi:hypothetical protein